MKNSKVLAVFGRVSVLMTIAFVCGFMNFSFLLIVILTSGMLYDRHRKQGYQKKREDFLIRREAHDANHLRLLMQQVPPWVDFSQKEKVEWLNTLLETIWPFAKEATEKNIHDALTPLFAQFKPDFLSELAFDTLDLGDVPPVVESISTRLKDDNLEEEGDEQIQLDVAVNMSSETNIVVAAKTRAVSLLTKLADLSVIGTMRVVIAPLCDTIPCFKALSVSFVSKPQISFKLKSFKVPVTAIPKFKDWIDDFLGNTLAYTFVWPKKIIVPLQELTDEERRICSDVSAEGILWVEVVGAENLRNADALGKSDPYAKVMLGDVSAKTEVVDNDLNPVWNFRSQFLVHDARNETLRILLRDDDVGEDKKLGNVEIELGGLERREGDRLSRKIVVTNGTGYVDVVVEFNRFRFFPGNYPEWIFKDRGLPPENESEAIDRDDRKWRTGFPRRVAIVTVKSCTGLPIKNSVVQVRCDDVMFPSPAKMETQPKWDTNDPEFHEAFSLVLKDEYISPRIIFSVCEPNSSKSVAYAEVLLFEHIRNGSAMSGIAIDVDLKSTKAGQKVGSLAVRLCLKVICKALRALESKELSPMEIEKQRKQVKELEKQLGNPYTVVLESAGGISLAFLAGYFFGPTIPGLVLGGIGVVAKVLFSLERHKARSKLGKLTKVLVLTHFDRSLDNPDAVMPFLESLPEWVSDPTVEKNEWLNELLITLWPSIQAAARKEILAKVTPILDKNRPKFMNVLRLKEVRLGNTAPLVTGVRAFPRHKVGQMTILDLDLALCNDFKIVVELGAYGMTTRITVTDLSFSGTLRVKLYDLVGQWPCFSRMSVSFRVPPNVDFSVALGALPLMSLPGVRAMADSFLEQTLRSMLVWPNDLSFPVLSVKGGNQVQALESESGQGVLFVYIRKAKGLRNSDLFGKSDPFVIITVGDGVTSEEKRTRVIDDDLNPEWEERFEFILMKQDVEIDFMIMDEDVGEDELLGEVHQTVGDLPDNVRVRIDSPVIYKNKPKGRFFADVEWRPYVAQPAKRSVATRGEAGEKAESVTAGESGAGDEGPSTVIVVPPPTQQMHLPVVVPDNPKDWSRYILLVRVQRCRNLGRVGRKNADPPVAGIFVRLQKSVQRILCTETTCNPVFRKLLVFHIKDDGSMEKDGDDGWNILQFKVFQQDLHARKDARSEAKKSKTVKTPSLALTDRIRGRCEATVAQSAAMVSGKEQIGPSDQLLEEKDVLGTFSLSLKTILEERGAGGEYPLRDSDGSIVLHYVLKEILPGSVHEPIPVEQCAEMRARFGVTEGDAAAGEKKEKRHRHKKDKDKDKDAGGGTAEEEPAATGEDGTGESSPATNNLTDLMGGASSGDNEGMQERISEMEMALSDLQDNIRSLALENMMLKQQVEEKDRQLQELVLGDG
mmetsp:Transcript_12001/g.33825  ORF Transcript_12001/g.33825 Transcript_12001/m.33825 type:complete len:1402 (+) Transcript_12001:47-4252(+)